MKKHSKLLAIPLAASIALGSFCGVAYADPTFGILHEQHQFYDLSYVYRNGYECANGAIFPTLEARSWMWVRNNIRSVGDGAIFSQAGLTNTNAWTLQRDAIFGPGIWNSGSNPAGHAIESYLSQGIPMYTSVVAWGNGFVRDPNSEYHQCPTEENTVFIFQ